MRAYTHTYIYNYVYIVIYIYTLHYIYGLRCRLKPNMLFCYVFASRFCYVNPVASHVCDVNPDVDSGFGFC